MEGNKRTCAKCCVTSISRLRTSIKDVRKRVQGVGIGPMQTDADGERERDSGHADVCKIALILPLILSTNTVLFTFGL